ncbi:MAG: hypothetical protein IIC27_00975 [Chloroflexi bacterium]|nr:hypothetical protein [Chloroflexota bacterium]
MTSGNRESRFEELRRKARERLDQVRQNIEREMGGSTQKREPPAPDRFEDMFTTKERESPPEVPQERAPMPEMDHSADAWKQRVVVPSSQEDEPAPAFEAPRIGPTISTTPTLAVDDVSDAQQQSTTRTRRSPAAQLLKKGALRQAIIAQEILGKPLSMRPPPDEE